MLLLVLMLLVVLVCVPLLAGLWLVKSPMKSQEKTLRVSLFLLGWPPALVLLLFVLWLLTSS